MELALASRSLGAAHPLEEDIRVAAITGFPWLVIDYEKCKRFLAQADFDIRDLRRLFLRTQPAALDGLCLPNSSPLHLPEVEALCKQARRLGVPVVVARIAQPDERIVALADVAQKWSTVLALVADDSSFEEVRRLVRGANHPALGLYVDVVALWREAPEALLLPADAAITVLLAVGDMDADGVPVLPGEGIVPLRRLLTPLVIGDYDSLALLAVEGAEEAANPQFLASKGRAALSELLTSMGWVVEW
jgi:sugar phosphate isomerase/epimerase